MGRPGLLVSVRSVAEAREALAGGADLIDVKEPRRGSLGRADDSTLEAIVREVAGRRPVSAAMGELIEGADAPAQLTEQFAFVKWGLAGYAGHDWRSALSALRASRRNQVVTVAYADWEAARAPTLDEVCKFACQHPGGVLLVDTWEKVAGRTLLDCQSVADLSALCRRCRGCDVSVALAGSLGTAEIEQLLTAGPRWFAVRGAVCAGGERTGVVDSDRVRALTDLLARSRENSRCG